MNMPRRDFVKGAAVAAACSAGRAAWGAEDVLEVDAHVFPDWVSAPIRACAARYRAWKGEDLTVAFPIMTDCHSWYWGFSKLNLRRPDDVKKATEENLNLSFSGPENWGDPKLHVLMMRKLAELVGADFLADLGDHDFEFTAFGEPIPIELARKAMLPYRKLYESERLPTLFTRGNHDHSRGRIGDREYGDLFNRSLNAAKNLTWTLSEDGTFGFLDLPAKRFRAIFLNSSRNVRNGLDGEQLRFLSASLASAPADWHVVLMEHIPVKHMQHWHRSLSATEDRNMPVAYAMLDSFVHRRGDFYQGWKRDAPKNTWQIGGADGAVTWCFKDAKAHFAGGFFGHEHVEDFIGYGNVPIVMRPGMGTVPRDCIAGEMHDPKNGGYLPPRTILLDLVAIKPERRTVHVFRAGLGGEACDLDYRY